MWRGIFMADMVLSVRNAWYGTGPALANQYWGQENASFTFFGDGAANQGQVMRVNGRLMEAARDLYYRKQSICDGYIC